jgi:hypothetical protein
MTAVKEFAGEDQTRPVIYPKAELLLTRMDARAAVSHRDLILNCTGSGFPTAFHVWSGECLLHKSYRTKLTHATCLRAATIVR